MSDGYHYPLADTPSTRLSLSKDTGQNGSLKKASFKSPPQSSFDRTKASAVSDPLMTV